MKNDKIDNPPTLELALRADEKSATPDKVFYVKTRNTTSLYLKQPTGRVLIVAWKGDINHLPPAKRLGIIAHIFTNLSTLGYDPHQASELFAAEVQARRHA